MCRFIAVNIIELNWDFPANHVWLLEGIQIMRPRNTIVIGWDGGIVHRSIDQTTEEMSGTKSNLLLTCGLSAEILGYNMVFKFDLITWNSYGVMSFTQHFLVSGSCDQYDQIAPESCIRCAAKPQVCIHDTCMVYHYKLQLVRFIQIPDAWVYWSLSKLVSLDWVSNPLVLWQTPDIFKAQMKRLDFWSTCSTRGSNLNQIGEPTFCSRRWWRWSSSWPPCNSQPSELKGVVPAGADDVVLDLSSYKVAVCYGKLPIYRWFSY